MPSAPNEGRQGSKGARRRAAPRASARPIAPSFFLGLGPDSPEGRAAEAAVNILPLPYGGTVSWGKGTEEGPAALFEASVHMEPWDEVLDREPHRIGIHTLPAPRMPADPERAVETARRETSRVLAAGKFPVVIGGEHSLSYGVFQALAECHGEIGVVQFDAHADLRDVYGGTRFSHGCVMRRIHDHTDHVVQLGVRSLSAEEADLVRRRHFAVGFMHRLRSGRFDAEAALARLPKNVYLTFDVDGLDPALIRSTGTPEPGGLTWEEANHLLRLVFTTKRVVGMDMMELCAGDPASAFCAARLLYRMIGWAFPCRRG